MNIVLVNKSNRFTDTAALQAIATACNAQLVDLAAAWGRVPGSVRVGEENVHEAPVIIFDDADVANALGYHSETPAGQVFARVFVKAITDAGGAALLGPVSIAATVSHEICEMFVDATCNNWADDGRGGLYAIEVADAVERDCYEHDVDGQAVSLSNFLYPAAFDRRPPPGSRLDHMGLTSRPFELRPGGYAIFMRDGRVGQVFGDRYPAWKFGAKAHDSSRTARRLQARG